MFVLLLMSSSIDSVQVPPARPPANQRRFTSPAIEAEIKRVTGVLRDHDLATLFSNAFPNTLDTTVYQTTDGDTFVITGDIEASWLRDSSNQLKVYIPFAKQDPALQKLLSLAIRFQAKKIAVDPHANAFYGDTSRVSPWNGDTTTFLSFAGTHTPAMTNWLHERKFEVDSLCSFFELSTTYANTTGDLAPFDAAWQSSALRAVLVLREQQLRDTRKNQGSSDAHYRFERLTTRPSDTLMDGVGAPSRACGLIASGFRPSDDACVFPYNIPQNAMAVVQLRALAQLAQQLGNSELIQQASSLANDVDVAIQQSGIVTHPVTGQRVYAFEVDGFGNALFIDDGNIPSLLSLPLLGYVSHHDPVYQATRQYVLSERTNPWYFELRGVGGVGSQHTGFGHVWPMSLIARALTTDDENEISALLGAIKNSTCGTGLMHESVTTDGGSFTRSWFAWANSLFGQCIETLLKTHPHVLT